MTRARAARRGVSGWVRIVFTALLLALILRKISAGEILSALASASPAPMAAGLSLGIAFLILKVERWWWLLRRLGVEASPREAFASYLGGMAVGLATPGRVGEVARSVYLRTNDTLFVTGAAFLDKIFDVAVILAVGAVGCAAQGYALAAAGLAAGAVMLATGPLLPVSFLRAMTRRVPLAGVRRIVEALARPLEHAGVGVVAGGLVRAAAAFGIALLQFHLFLMSFGPSPVGATLFVLPLIVLSNLVPLTLSGLGVREWAAVILLARYGVGGAAAVNVSLLGFVVNSLAPGVAGSLLAPRWRRSGTTPSEAG